MSVRGLKCCLMLLNKEALLFALLSSRIQNTIADRFLFSPQINPSYSVFFRRGAEIILRRRGESQILSNELRRNENALTSDRLTRCVLNQASVTLRRTRFGEGIPEFGLFITSVWRLRELPRTWGPTLGGGFGGSQTLHQLDDETSRSSSPLSFICISQTPVPHPMCLSACLCV